MHLFTCPLISPNPPPGLQMSPVTKPVLPEECHGGVPGGVRSWCSFKTQILTASSSFLNDDTLWTWGWGETDAHIHFWKEYKRVMPFTWAIWQYICTALNVCITFYLASLLVRKSSDKGTKNYMYRAVHWSTFDDGKSWKPPKLPNCRSWMSGPITTMEDQRPLKRRVLFINVGKCFAHIFKWKGGFPKSMQSVI